MASISYLARGRLLFALQVVALFVIATSLYLSRDHLSKIPMPHLPGKKQSHGSSAVKDGVLSSANLTRVVDAIMDPTATHLPRLECPTVLDETRYDSLRASPSTPHSSLAAEKLVYYFAIDLRNSIEILPRLLGSVVEAIRYLGPASCSLSIVEGNSDDGTDEVLRALERTLDRELGTIYYLTTNSTIDSKIKGGDRIGSLAALRNAALAPLLDSPRAGPNTTVIFLNDVAICPEDILELILQRHVQEADMVCGLDWVYVLDDPSFYDVWIARTLTGNTFFEIPPDGNWNLAWNLFSKEEDAVSRARFEAHKPFQVFACWNGAAVFGAAPLLPSTPTAATTTTSSSSSSVTATATPAVKWANSTTNATAAIPGHGRPDHDDGAGLKFRRPREGECGQGEPQLFCKDLWWRGHGRIAVVPSVNLEYGDENAKRVKDLKGYASALVEKGPPMGQELADRIKWQDEPPPMVKCMPNFKNQTWAPWDEAMV